MDFEWDEAKRLQVLRERSIDFIDAALIFEGFVITRRDDRHDYGEERYVSIGVADGKHFVVVHTRRGEAIRLISAWKASRSKQSECQAGVARGDQGDEGQG